MFRIKKVPIVLFLVLIASIIQSCQDRESKFKKAIKWYYFESGRSTGAGEHSADIIKIIEVVKLNFDTTFVLASVTGNYSHPPLENQPADEYLEEELWFIIKAENSHYKVVGIRDPKVFKPES